jgi:hypothetical protein
MRRSASHVECLESRTLLSLTVQLDFTLDANNFFDTSAKRSVLQSAVDAAVARFSDHLEAIDPSPILGNIWTATVANPATGANSNFTNLNIPSDTLLVFVGGRNIAELGIGGPGGFASSGSADWNATVASRGENNTSGSNATDFGPYGGSIVFDSSPAGGWYFGTDPAGINGKNDFYSVALHEMTHVLGFGTSDAFSADVKNGKFTGPSAVAAYDGAGDVPLNSDNAHWASGTKDNGVETAMDPELTTGTRKLLTPLDIAAMDDIGWDVPIDATLSPVATITTRGGASTTFTVTYDHYTDIDTTTIGNDDLTIGGPRNFKGTATLVSAAPATSDADGTSIVATYSFAAPGGTFDSADSGSYSVSAAKNSVGDAFGNSVLAKSLGNITVDIDPPPTASLAAQNVFQIGGATHTFTVTYSDDDGINTSTIDANDVTVTRNSDGMALALIGVSVTPSGAAANAPQVVTYTVAAPGGAWDPPDNGTYTVSLGANQIVDVKGTPADAAALGTFDVTIGVLTFSAGKNITYTDASGDVVTVSLKGPGSGQVLFDAPGNADAGEIVVTDSTKASALTIKPAGAGTSVAAISVNGLLKSITGKNVDLAGPMTIGGGVPKVQFRNASGSMQLGGTTAATITLAQARDLSITAAATIKSIKATEWLDTDATPDVITAPTVNTVSSKGAFQAGIAAGVIGKLTVSGEMAGADIRADQSINGVTVGSVKDSRVFAGVTGNSLPTSPDEFTGGAAATSAIKAFTVKSKAAGAFSDTEIAAAQIGKLVLGSILSGNGGTPFGASGLTIKSVTGLTDTGTAIKASKLDDPAGSVAVGDFVIRLL